MTQLDEPLSLPTLLDGAMRQARRHFRAVYPAVAVPTALFAGAMPFLQGLWLPAFAGGRGGTPDPTRFFAGMWALFGVVGLSLLLYIVAHATLTAGAVDAVAGRPVSMTSSWRRMLHPRALVTLALVYLVAFVGMMCCLLPGIYVALLWSMVIPVMVEERRFMIDSLGRSTDLARYNPRREFGADPRVRAFLVYLIGLLAMYAAAFVVQLPLIVVQQVMMFRGLAGGERVDPMAITERLVWLQVPTGIVTSLAQMAVQVFVSCGIALLYFDVRRRKEGLDLEAAVDRLARPGAPTADSGA